MRKIEIEQGHSGQNNVAVFTQTTELLLTSAGVSTVDQSSASFGESGQGAFSAAAPRPGRGLNGCLYSTPAPDASSKSSQLEGEQIQGTKGKETRGDMFGSHSFLSILILLPWAFFSPLSPPAHYRTPPLYVPSPLTFFPLCSSLFPLTPLSCSPLSPSICWNSAADNACNWSDSRFFSVFGPDKEYCQHFADTASAGRIKRTLFCSVCSKLKASQFICSPPRLTGASYSHRNAAEMWRQENKREFPKKR